MTTNFANTLYGMILTGDELVISNPLLRPVVKKVSGIIAGRRIKVRTLNGGYVNEPAEILYDWCERWLAENPGEYPYVRLAAAVKPVEYWRQDELDMWAGGKAAVTDEKVLKEAVNRVYNGPAPALWIDSEYRELLARAGKRGGRGGDLAYRMRRGGLNKKETNELYTYLRKEYVAKVLGETTDDFRWPVIWKIFNLCNPDNNVGVAEFLTKYCEVRPLENK